MDILIVIVVICVIASTMKKNQTRNQKQSHGRTVSREPSHWGTQTIHPRKKARTSQATSRQSKNPAGSPLPEFPRSSSDWDSSDRKAGEDELEALIRQNHAYEEELKKLLAIRDE